jgi:two-component system, cell cycle sensor histidine kinase PleC
VYAQQSKPAGRSLLSRYSADLGSLILRRRSEQALRAAALESASANRAKSQFLANMSHELRTPLNAIIGFADLVGQIGAEHTERRKTVEYARHISNAGQHLLNVVSDILDISKIESGTLALDFETGALVEIIEAAMTLVRPRIVEKKQKLEMRLAGYIPPLVLDVRRIKQVLINLLSNAHKFTREGGQIWVDVMLHKESGAVTVGVTDTGVGMAADEVQQALTPFGQIQSTYTRSQEGTGLGLPIAKALVEHHGGTFLISSRPDAGTTVAFTLPPKPPGFHEAPTGKASPT